MARFYYKNIIGENVDLIGSEAAHLINVMRLKVGDHAELFDGKGKLAQAKITSTTKKSAHLKIQSIDIQLPRTSGRIVIAASIAKGQRFDWMVSKCTELGADHIAPIICERTVKLAKGAKVVERLEKLAVSAAKQCRRVFLPTISEPQTLVSLLESLKVDYPEAKVVFGGLGEGSVSSGQLWCETDVVAIVGPEGGFTEAEEILLKENDAAAIRLTDTILRTETAAMAFASILCAMRDAAKF